MKTMLMARLALSTFATFLASMPLQAATTTNIYTGNGNSDVNYAVGGGTMTLRAVGNSVYGRVNIGGGSPNGFTDFLILYIDSQPGGFTTTAGFADTSNPTTKSVSGFSGTRRATANFAPGLAADYAIVLSRGALCHAIYTLANGSSLGLAHNITWSDNTAYWDFSFLLSDIGTTTPYFTFQSTVTSYMGTGYRSLESYESLTGLAGFNTVNFSNFNTFGIDPVPEPSNVALAVFAGLVVVGGGASRLRRHFHERAVVRAV